MPGYTPEQLLQYGPSQTIKEEDHTHFPTHSHLTGYAGKILRDLTHIAKLYDGKLMDLYRPGKIGDEYCPICTDTITGGRVYTNCETCSGTGYTLKYSLVGSFWCRVDFSPKLKSVSELGTYDRLGHRDTFMILGAPVVKDRWILHHPEINEIYKVLDLEGQIVAMQGVVISQVLNCLLLSPGSVEYKAIQEM